MSRSLFRLALVATVSCVVADPERIFFPRTPSNVKPSTFNGLNPHIDFYPAAEATDTAILVCPGGGYRMLSWEKEGVQPAQFYAAHGIDAFVLSYTLLTPHPAAFVDANSALDIIKARPANYKRIGIIGFSAGGHLAAIVTTLNAKRADRIVPAFCFLIYPVITMDPVYTHQGSYDIVLSRPVSQDMVNSLSAEKQVGAGVPPTVLVHSIDDEVVSVENSLWYLSALRRHGVRAAAMLFDHGGHGFGPGYIRGTTTLDDMLSGWPEYTIQFLRNIEFIA